VLLSPSTSNGLPSSAVPECAERTYPEEESRGKRNSPRTIPFLDLWCVGRKGMIELRLSFPPTWQARPGTRVPSRLVRVRHPDSDLSRAS